LWDTRRRLEEEEEFPRRRREEVKEQLGLDEEERLFRGWGWSGIGAAMVEVSPEIPVPIANLTHTKVLTHRSVNEMFISLVIIKKKIQRVSDRR
jgi:hypothetical protein